MAPGKREKSANPVLALGAVEVRDRLASGALRAVEYAQACLDLIAVREPEIQAWAWLDSDHVLAQAAALDARRLSGAPIGPLHGVPVALKDVIDTAKIPTENGTPIDAGRVPDKDAVIVAKLKAAGAIIMGKTVTTELAFMHPSKTRNPHNSAHTPGGSSAGSAAAVAAGMVPLAVGTQTGGSVIRPAAFCGITGFKPTFGAIPRTGILPQSPSLDTVGVFARTVEDAALLAEILFGYDPQDSATEPAPTPRLLSVAGSNPPVTPTLAFVRVPGFDDADAQTHLAMAELVEVLGEYCFEAPLPAVFNEAADIRARINAAEMAKCYYSLERRGRDKMSPELTRMMDKGKDILARDYIAALDWRELYNAALNEILDRCDAIITPATLGPAPEGLTTTGNPVFNGLWTLCGTPAVTIPVFWAENGMPMGVQLIGRRGDDARLLRTARWLADHITSLGDKGETA
ncbi:amidase [Thalassospira sp.]|uniref:amidase n=1 Tax=Thalassospira sp. TaxID=1912094 RepID=UPI0027337712|nr:amidase [Thalassospira sp.]MDP2696536.1 amidase [Thalassospira sp.]